MQSVGLSEKEIIKAIAGLRAFGEIMKLPPAVLDPVLQKAEATLREKPSVPPKPPPTP